MNCHLIHAHAFRIHVSEAARSELGGAAALESIQGHDPLAAMSAREVKEARAAVAAKRYRRRSCCPAGPAPLPTAAPEFRDCPG